jgi:dTDP-4-dehydrorhamnose reductase
MKVLVTGAGGQLGTDVVAELRGRHEVTPCGHAELDVADADSVTNCLTRVHPEMVVNCAAWTAVDACEGDPERADRVNGAGPANLVAAAELIGARIVHMSTDYVFDGSKPTPYVETDEPNPASVYGRSKLLGEHAMRPEDTVLRTAWVMGPHGNNMLKTVLRLLESDGELHFVDDQHGCPTFTGDLATAVGWFVDEDHPGLFHVTNAGPTSWYELACEISEVAGHDAGRVHPIATADLDPPRPAPRPANSVLENAALRDVGLPQLRDHREALAETLAAIR